MTKLQIEVADGVTKLIGALNSTSIAQLKAKAHKQIIKQRDMSVDLAQVIDVDTAGLAWLLYLLEQANHQNCQLSFAHLPPDLLNLAELSAVREFLPEQSTSC